MWACSLSLDISTPLFRPRETRHTLFTPVDLTVHPPQHHGADSHDQRGKRKQPSPLRRIQNVKNRVWVEAISTGAGLDPEPVAGGDGAAEREGGKEGDGVGRGEEEQIDDKGDGGDGVEG